jgi:hypothetical protein
LSASAQVSLIAGVLALCVSLTACCFMPFAPFLGLALSMVALGAGLHARWGGSERSKSAAMTGIVLGAIAFFFSSFPFLLMLWAWLGA